VQTRPPSAADTADGPHSWLAAVVAATLAAAVTTALTMAPVLLHPSTRLLGLPEVEAVEHLWTLWLGAQAGPVRIDTPLASYPFGYQWVLADPLNLLWYLPGAWLSPVVGFHLVHACNLIMAGLTAVVTARVLLPGRPPPAWVIAALVPAAVPFAGNLLTGMSEAQTLWLAVLGPVLLLVGVRRGGQWLAAGALACGATAWGGPYTALYAALLAPVLVGPGLLAARRSLGLPVVLRRLTVATAGTAALAAPVLWAVATQRPDGLPGTESMTATVLADPSLMHNRYLGADLLGLLAPIVPEGSTLVHATYLGAMVLLLALVGCRARRPWALLVGVGWSCLLGLGLYLQAGGEVAMAGGRILLLPAGWLSLAVPVLGRAARWHRFLEVAAILLAPLAAAGATALVARLPRRAAGPLLALVVAACVTDQLLVSPLAWPRPTQDATPPPLYFALPDAGPLIIVPKQPKRIRGLPRSPARSLLWQTAHGMPIAERPMYQRTLPELQSLRDDLRVGAKLHDEYRTRRAREGLRELGYAWIVHHDEPGNTITSEELVAVLGPPDVNAGDGMAWRP